MQKSPAHKLHAGHRGLLEYTALLIITGVVYLGINTLTPNTVAQRVPLMHSVVVILVLWLLAVLYGFFHRAAWVWLNSFACFSAVLIYSFVLHYFLLKFELIPFELFLLLSLFSLLINGTVLWYLSQKKQYFLNPFIVDHFGVTDKVFVNLLLCLVVLLLAISFTALKFLK